MLICSQSASAVTESSSLEKAGSSVYDCQSNVMFVGVIVFMMLCTPTYILVSESGLSISYTFTKQNLFNIFGYLALLTFAVLKTSVLQSGRMLTDQGGRS